MKVIAVIPARMGSSRFPGKPLAPILGRPMVEHVYRRAAMTPGLASVYVATCDREIGDAVERFGGQVIMTSAAHERASDRTAEAVQRMGDVDVVVMVQGDEPMITPEMVQAAMQPLLDDRSILCANLAKRITDPEEFSDFNCPKVVMDRQGFALYFSREPIPTRGVLGFERLDVYKQVCIIPFQREALIRFTKLEPTRLEQAESIDMLRFLEHGYRVKLVETTVNSHAVDTPADLALVESLMRDDPLTPSY